MPRTIKARSYGFLNAKKLSQINFIPILLSLTITARVQAGDMTSYSNSSAGFSILFPVDWSWQESSKNAVVVARKMADASAGTGLARIGVTARRLTTDESLQALSEAFKKSLNQGEEKVTFLKQGTEPLGGHSGIDILARSSFSDGNQTVVLCQHFYLGLHSGRFYTVSCTCLEKDKRRFFPVFNRILQSFQYLNAQEGSSQKSNDLIAPSGRWAVRTTGTQESWYRCRPAGDKDLPTQSGLSLCTSSNAMINIFEDLTEDRVPADKRSQEDTFVEESLQIGHTDTPTFIPLDKIFKGKFWVYTDPNTTMDYRAAFQVGDHWVFYFANTDITDAKTSETQSDILSIAKSFHIL